MHITTHWRMTRWMTDGQHNQAMKGVTTSTCEGTSNGNGGGSRCNTSRGPGMFFLFLFFIFLTTTYSTMRTTTTKLAWLLLHKMAKLYQTQTTADVVLHTGIFTLCFYSCFFQLNNILIFRTQVNKGWPKPTKVYACLRRPTKANTDPWKPTQANEDPWKPTRAHESQHRPKRIYEGQRRQAWMITMDPM